MDEINELTEKLINEYDVTTLSPVLVALALKYAQADLIFAHFEKYGMPPSGNMKAEDVTKHAVKIVTGMLNYNDKLQGD